MSLFSSNYSSQTDSFRTKHSISIRGILTAVVAMLPNVLVFSFLAVIMVYGHHTDWKMPKFSKLIGTAVDTTDDWCSEHLVPESICIECSPDLLPRPQEYGFCKEHGVAECVIHHPELAQTRDAPRLPKYDTIQPIALINRPENNSRNSMHKRYIQFATAESVAKADIDVDVVSEALMTDYITANGELIFDPNRVGLLSPKVSGTVVAVYKTVGDDVKAGEILALIDASQVGLLKSELMQNIVQLQLRQSTVERLRPLAETGAMVVKTLNEAEAALQESEVMLLSTKQVLGNLGFTIPDDLVQETLKTIAERLQFIGIPDSIVNSLPHDTKTTNLIPVLAYYDGVLMSSNVTIGMVVEASQPLFTVVDPQKMWISLNVRQEDAPYIHKDLPVTFQSDDGQHNVNGQVSWISPAVNEQTRTLHVRVVVDNPEGLLRDKTYGIAKIILREELHAVIVPREAVQSTIDCHYVFVRDKHYFAEDSPKFFHVRQVRIGAYNDHYVELLAGVLPGEVIAVKGSNVLLAHLLRSNLGAGCCVNEN